jgi:hypothetical protein
MQTKSAILGIGVMYTSPSGKSPTIETGPEQASHVLQVLSDAIANVHNRRMVSNEITLSSSGSDIFSMPEQLQQLVRSSGGDIRLLSAHPLFKYVWVEGFSPFFGIAAVVLVSLIIYAATPSVVASPAAPSAMNVTAPVTMNTITPVAANSTVPESNDSSSGNHFNPSFVIGGFAAFVVLFLGLMTCSSGVFGRISAALTSSSLIFVKSWFGSAVIFGADKLSHRETIQGGFVIIPVTRSCLSTPMGYISVRGASIPVPDPLSTYNWILAEAALSPAGSSWETVL